jgi:hypothetical protein
MWINCYATIYLKKTVPLHENQLDGRLFHRLFIGVVRFYCFIFDHFILMDRKCSPLKTRARSFLHILLQLEAFSESRRSSLPNGYGPFHSKQVEIVEAKREIS